MAADPTILPRRVLERQARLHQWLQDVPGLTSAEFVLANWLIVRGNRFASVLATYEEIVADNGAQSVRTATRTVASLVDKGLIAIEAGEHRHRRLRLIVPEITGEPPAPVAPVRLRRRPGRPEMAYRRTLVNDPCAYCGAPSAVLDHIEPRAHGGADGWENLTGACGSCNASKGANSLLGHLLIQRLRISQRHVVGQIAVSRQVGRPAGV